MPDFDRYATGYQLTDWITAPYWHFVGWRAIRRLDRALGITGNRQERRAQRRELWQTVATPERPDEGDDLGPSYISEAWLEHQTIERLVQAVSLLLAEHPGFDPIRSDLFDAASQSGHLGEIR